MIGHVKKQNLKKDYYSIMLITVAITLAVFFVCSPGVFAGWAVNGNAFVSGGIVVLTPNQTDQAGSAWIETRIDLAKDFDISFRIYLGTNDGGADGISFALQNDARGTAAFGYTGGGGEWIGMNQICPALGIEVDTYYNSNRGDGTADHIGVNVFTGATPVCSGLPNHAGAGPVQAKTSSTNIEDGQEHDFRVTWNASTHDLYIYFDGSQRLSYHNDIIRNIFSDISMVYFGFTASTGAAYNYQYIIPNSADVSGSKTVEPGWFLYGDPNKEATYTIEITNNGVVTAFGTQITDTLPPGFSYITGSTTGATTSNPSISGQELRWNLSATPIPPNGGTRTISFMTSVPNIVGSYPNSFTASGDNFVTIERTAIATVLVGPADLAIEKAHTGYFTAGVNGIYSFNVINYGPDQAEKISLTDIFPTGIGYVSHSGNGWSLSVSSGQTYTWAYAGTLPSGTSLPTLYVTVLPNSNAVPMVVNMATVTSERDNNPENNSASDPTTVLGPGAANKPLYVRGESGRELSRSTTVGTTTPVTLNGIGGIGTWTLTPATYRNIILSEGSHPVRFQISRNDRGTSRTVQIALASIGATTSPIGAPVAQTFTIPPDEAGITEIVFNINLSESLTINAGSQITMIVTNQTAGNTNRRISVYPLWNNNYSSVNLSSGTVLSITSLEVFDTAYPNGNSPVSFLPGSIVYIRATVSDPFGSFDITDSDVDIVNPYGIKIINSAVMTQVFDSGTDSKIYEYPYATPMTPVGEWTARVRASEGTEGIVTDIQSTTFAVLPLFPSLVILKTAQTIYDPYNEGINPKAIPGGQIRYLIRATNTGQGIIDTDTFICTDAINTRTELYVSDLTGYGTGPMQFIDGTIPSGLTYTYISLSNATDDIDFSNDNGATYTYIPLPDSDGFDSTVTNLRINPKGQFNAAGAANPYCDIIFKVRVK